MIFEVMYKWKRKMALMIEIHQFLKYHERRERLRKEKEEREWLAFERELERWKEEDRRMVFCILKIGAYISLLINHLLEV